MKAKITLSGLLMIVFSMTMVGQTSSSATYSSGNIKSDRSFGNAAQSSSCPGTLIVSIPAGAIITSVDVTYAYEALPGSYRAFQVSQLRCISPGGINEATLATNTNYTAGIQTYTRTGLTIANGVSAGGDITFQLHAGVTYGSQVGCSEQYQRVNNNTWTVTVHYLNPSYPSAPTNPNPATEASNVSVNIQNITWTFGANSNFYDVYFGTTNPPSTKVVNNQPIGGTNGSYSCGTLNPGTKFYWQVVVRNNFQIEVAGPDWNFSTECAPTGTPININFDDLVVPSSGSGNPPPNILPLCWTMQYQCSLGYAAQGVYSTQYAYTQPNCWIFSNEGDGSAYNIMIMPEMAASLSTLQLSFIARTLNSVSTLSIGTMADKNSPATFTQLSTITANTLFQQFDIPFAAYTGTDKFMAVKFTSPGPNNYSYIYLDNVFICEIPTCPRPRDLVPVELLGTSAEVSWLETGSASQWNLEVVPAGTVPTGNSVSINSNPYTITGLQPATNYDFYIQSDCGNGSLSYWSNKGTFKTACTDFVPPFTENFDASTNLPACWSVFKTLGSSSTIQSYGGYSLPNCFAMTLSSTSATVILVSPPIDGPTGDLSEIKLNFFSKRTSFEDNFIVGTMTNPLDPETFTPFKTIMPTTSWAEYEVWFNTYTGTNKYIGFKMGNLSNTATINLDNITFGVLPYCVNPIDLSVNEIHETNARLHWTESREAIQWEIEVGPSGFIPGTNAYTQTYIYDLVEQDYSFVMTGLLPQTFYDVYIRAHCGNGDVSLWSPKAQFMSQPESFGTLPLIETFEPGFTWTYNPPTNNTNWTLFSTLFHSTPNCARNQYGLTNKNVLLISRRIDLSAKTNAFLSFWHIAKTDGDRDHCYVEISTDGGANYDQLPVSTYIGLGKYYQPTQNLPEGPSFDEDSYTEWGTGSETPTNTWWKNENFDLSAYAGSNNVVIRFRLVTDNSTNKYGWLLDDISIKAYNGVGSEMNPLSFEVELQSGETTTETLTVTNTGDFPLVYTASVQNFTDGITTLVSQDFEAGLPADWTFINGAQSSSNSWWHWAEAGVAQYNLNGTDYMLAGRVYPDICDEQMISPIFDGTNQSNVFVTFDHVYVKASSTSSPDYAELSVWDGSAWHSLLYLKTSNVGSWGAPVTYSIDITQYANPQMKIKFYYAGTNTSKWGIDNFSITASDIPLNWLTLNTKPTIRGLLQGGESQALEVGFEARPSFPENVWHSEIQIVSNDPANSPVVIPVSMTIGCGQPWNFTQTGLVHNISIPQGIVPEIEGEPLQNNDWIGVFFLNENNQETCGGVLRWNGNGGLVINAYGDDPTTQEKDGFAAGEAFNWRMKRCGDAVVYSALAEYDQSMPNTSYFADFGLSKLINLKTPVSQHFTFDQGWNSLSGYIIPQDLSVENMFEPIENNLIILRNLTSLYWPSENINTIGNWDYTIGYVLKVNAETDFDIHGLNYSDGNITVTSGWQYLPVLSLCPVEISSMFSNNLGNIIIIQEIIGNRVFWPQMQIYTLTTLEPGKAYKMKTMNGFNVSFPACPAKGNSMIIPEKNEETIPWGTLNLTPVSQLVVFLPEALNNLDNGDKIGAFDKNGNIRGYCEISDKNQPQSLVLVGDDNTADEKNGFYNNESVSYRIFSTASNEEVGVEAVYSNILENITGTFIPESFAAVSELKISNTGIGETSDCRIQIFPNPASDVLNITGFSNKTEIRILNVFGEEIQFTELTESAQIDVSQLAKGTYIVKFSQNQGSAFKKLIIR